MQARRRRSGAPDEDTASAPAALVTAHLVRSAQRIAAVNDVAAGLGLAVGATIADARARHPDLAVEPHDPAADHALLVAVADACDRFTPLVALDPPDGVMLDITGCAHLFGGEAALARGVAGLAATRGLSARVALADTPGCAFAVARHGRAGGAPLVVPPGGQREALLRLPLAALRLAPERVAALAAVGLTHVADVIDLPRASVAARFDGLLDRLDAALGHLHTPITPRRPMPDLMTEQSLAEPVMLERDVLSTIERLAGRLARVLENRGEGARKLEAALFRTDGRVFRIAVGTGAPVRDPERIARLFADRLAVGEPCDPGFGYDLVRLSALATEPAGPVQTGLDANAADTVALDHLIDRLGVRFGARRVTRQVPQDTHVPESCCAALPAQARPRPVLPAAAEAEFLVDGLGPERPLRLLERPEPVEAVAEVPDGPPVRFRWRRVLHEVAAAEGPERLALPWWCTADAPPPTRDYFRVETRLGVRLWLFREGLYGRETPRPRWFLHGLFG
ncbi:DNA polymerase-like protein [Rhodovulum sp. PH10]|nr:DNA polymerase-like protein [Rhodovulum sp. PH10]